MGPFFVYDNNKNRLFKEHGFSKRYPTARGAKIAATRMNNERSEKGRFFAVDANWMGKNNVTTSVPLSCIPGTESYMSF